MAGGNRCSRPLAYWPSRKRPRWHLASVGIARQMARSLTRRRLPVERFTRQMSEWYCRKTVPVRSSLRWQRTFVRSPLCEACTPCSFGKISKGCFNNEFRKPTQRLGTHLAYEVRLDSLGAAMRLRLGSVGKYSRARRGWRRRRLGRCVWLTCF